MKVWLDALTSKQGTLLAHLSLELINKGFDVLITCRRYEYTEGSITRLGLKPIVIGEYSEGDSYDKVLSDITRMKELIRLIRKERPHVLIAYPNPSASRIAFGVGIKYVALTDSPHAEVPSRLSLPLADVIVASKCIPRAELISYAHPSAEIVQYEGVDEISWVIRSKPRLDYIKSLGLKPYEYVVLRPHEHLATYYKGIEVNVNIEELITKIDSYGLTTVFLPRYKVHDDLINKLVSRNVKVRTIKHYYDGVSLLYYSRAVITGGASLARESALLGVPAVTYYPGRLYVNECLKKFGYPLYTATSTNEILNIMKDILNTEVRRKDFSIIVNELRSKFEDVLSIIIDIVSRL